MILVPIYECLEIVLIYFLRSYDVTADDAYTFNWVFQKVGIGENVSSPQFVQNDMAKIYDIQVLNTESGGASECQRCPQGTEAQGQVYLICL